LRYEVYEGVILPNYQISKLPNYQILRWLDRKLFLRDPTYVACELLGKLLVRRQTGAWLAGRIVETEAYLGKDDPAAHAAAGRTPRNRVLFGPPAHAYVYLIYGNHYCLNVACLPEGEAGCVLFRALQPVAGKDEMARNRHLDLRQLSGKRVRLLTSGPGRLTQAMSITRLRDNGKDLLGPDSDLILLDDGLRPKRVGTSKRIGITKAADAPLRYFIAGNEFVSGTKREFAICDL
jgi:DNA-3-methyladenine glycosylase